MERTARSPALLALGVVVLGSLAYANSFQGAFVFDDVVQILDNPALRDLGRLLRRADGFQVQPNRFVPYASFAANVRLWGLSPAGFHAVNLLVHLATALALFGIVVLGFRTPRVRESPISGNAPAVAFTAAALFVTHPIQTQAVTYIVQRITSIAALFYLGSILLYLAWRLAPAAGRRRALPYLLSLGAALLAMRSKEIAFTLPFALLLLEWALFGRPTATRWAALAPFGAAALVIPLTLVQLGQPVGQVLAEASAATRVQATIGRLDYLRTEVAVLATYLRLLVWPSGQNIDHDFPLRFSFLDPGVLAAIAIHGSLLLLSAWAWTRSSPSARRPGDPAWRLVSVGILFFFLAHAVESSVIPIVDVIFEHRVYLPSMGFFVAVATGAAIGARRLRPARWAAWLVGSTVVGSLLLAGATLTRNRVWRTDIALWMDATSKSPGKARPWFNLATALAEAGRREEALEPMRRAVHLDPGWANARTQYGGLLILAGRPAEAEPELRESLRLKPGEPATTFNLAEALWRTGRRPEAAEVYARYLDLTASGGDPQMRRIAERRARVGTPASTP
jgi:tetratricopeptide (TPR) repeat protein